MPHPHFTELRVVYTFWPESSRPYRVVLSRGVMGRYTTVASCKTWENANKAGERASARYGLPFKPWGADT